MTELDLDRCFWNGLTHSEEFVNWLIAKTKFSERRLRLVMDELWHQCWYRDPDTGRESETDITLLLHDDATHERVALHIENKPRHGKWRQDQAESYQTRAENRKVHRNYVDFQTVLLAPKAFIDKYPREASHFDLWLTYEEVGQHIQEFRDI